MYWGETKTWYGISGSDADKFESAIKKEAPELFEQQPGLLYQLVTMMNPGRLSESGVKVVATDQRPNEFVITYPKAYHCGFNHGVGFNLVRSADCRSISTKLSTLHSLIGYLKVENALQDTKSTPSRPCSRTMSSSSQSHCIQGPSRLPYGEFIQVSIADT